MRKMIIICIAFIMLSILMTGCFNKSTNTPKTTVNDNTGSEKQAVEEPKVKQKDDNISVPNDDVKQSDVNEEKKQEISDEQLIKNLLYDFNKAWIEYVNNGSMKIMDYIVKDSEVEKDILAFDKTGLTEEMVTINVKKIEIEQDKALIHDYEKIKQLRSDKEIIKEYDWLYTAKKIDGKWLIESYVFDK